MITIKGPFSLLVQGDLSQFDPGNEFVTFIFRGGFTVEIKGVSEQMIQSLLTVGLQRLGDAEVNFVTGQISLGQKKAPGKPDQKDRNHIATVSMGMSR